MEESYIVQARHTQMDNARNNPNTIRAIDIINDKRDKGWNLTRIAEHMNAKGYPTARGKQWSKSQVHRIISKHCKAS